MDLNFTARRTGLPRTRSAHWVAENLPKDISHKVHNALRLSRDDLQRWARILGKKGWLGWGWPKQFGGPGWNAVQQHLFEEECALAGAPRVVPFGPVMVAPVIMAFGNARAAAALPARHRQRRGLVEPGLQRAGLGLRPGLAEVHAPSAQGDKYIVNGQKTWTTLGQYGDWIFCLVRTSSDGKPQTGISFLLIDMKSPGITVRPIIMLDGEHEVNEVFFDNVEVPAENLVGEENKGWTYAKHLLGARAHQHRRRQPRQARAGAAQAHRQGRGRVRRRALPRPDRAARGRHRGAGDDGAARAVGREERQAEPGRGRPAEDPRQRDPAALHRADDAGRRPLHACPSSTRRWKPAGRATIAVRRRTARRWPAPTSTAQDHDLRRQQRSATQHRRPQTVLAGRATTRPRTAAGRHLLHSARRRSTAGRTKCSATSCATVWGADHGLRLHRRPGIAARRGAPLGRQGLRLRAPARAWPRPAAPRARSTPNWPNWA